MTGTFEGKVAFITGVSYEMPTEDDLAETVRLVETAGGEILARVADVRGAESVVAAGTERFGRLDVVSANAGIGVNQAGDSWTLTLEHWRDMIDVNTLAIELAPHRLRANAVVPTQTLTPMIDNPSGYRAFRPGP